jgi:hypothetical protein
MQTYDSATKQFRKVADLHHLSQASRSSLWRDQTHGPLYGWDVCITFAFKAAKDAGQFDAKAAQLLQKPLSFFYRPGVAVRCV